MIPISELSMAKSKTDFVVSRFRERLGLWYEINEGSEAGKYVNNAHLTDGQSFLLLWFTSDPARFDNVSLLGKCDGVNLFIAWETRHDSRRQFDAHLVKSIARDAIADFQPDMHGNRCALVSFEFIPRSEGANVASWFAKYAPAAEFQEMPEYRGKLTDAPEFQIVEDPGGRWAQLVLRPAIAGKELVSLLSPCLDKFDSFEISTKGAYGATGEWQQIGIRRVHVLARHY